jgi:glycosyltransferase involved in cell wall biosynthesis
MNAPDRAAVVHEAASDRAHGGPAGPWLVFDDRWIADHGIGRVAREWLRLGSGWRSLGAGPSPASPTDPFWLAARLRDTELPFFSPGYNAPIASRQPFFVTVHDLCYIDAARHTGALRRLYYGTVVRRRCDAAHGVFTVSAFSRQRLIDAWGLDPRRVHVATPGVSDAFVPAGPVARFERPYLLVVGNASPHKNEARTVAAFMASGLPRTHDLVLTGAARPVSSAPLDACVRFTGRVDDGVLAALYRGADALVFASLYEGFGLPAVEAMACGTPVVCSRTTGLGEVAGDAALLVDPESTADLTRALERIVHDAPLAARLREAGPQRARRYDWAVGVRALERILRSELQARSVTCGAT